MSGDRFKQGDIIVNVRNVDSCIPDDVVAVVVRLDGDGSPLVEYMDDDDELVRDWVTDFDFELIEVVESPLFKALK